MLLPKRPLQCRYRFAWMAGAWVPYGLSSGLQCRYKAVEDVRLCPDPLRRSRNADI